MSKKYVGYYRVSTQRQEKSGLGLESQQSAVRDFAESKGELIEEFTEVVSGKSNKHDVLDEAIKLAKKKKDIINAPFFSSDDCSDCLHNYIYANLI